MKTLYEEDFIILKFNARFINKSHGDTKRRCVIKTRPKPKVNVQLRWISLFSKSSWIETTTSGLSYELGVNGSKMLMETEVLLIKMEIAHFTLVNIRVSAKKLLR